MTPKDQPDRGRLYGDVFSDMRMILLRSEHVARPTLLLPPADYDRIVATMREIEPSADEETP